MEKKRARAIALIITILFALSLIFDEAIVKAISSLQSSFLNQIMTIIGYLGILLILFVIAISVVLIHNRKKFIELVMSFAVTTIIIHLLKLIIQRARPFEALGLNTFSFLINKTYTTWNLSFPSAHSAIVFAALPFFEGKMKYYWLVFACLVAFSRVFFALHYMSDVIAGAVIGFAISSVFIKVFKLQKGIIK